MHLPEDGKLHKNSTDRLYIGWTWFEGGCAIPEIGNYTQTRYRPDCLEQAGLNTERRACAGEARQWLWFVDAVGRRTGIGVRSAPNTMSAGPGFLTVRATQRLYCAVRRHRLPAHTGIQTPCHRPQGAPDMSSRGLNGVDLTAYTGLQPRAKPVYKSAIHIPECEFPRRATRPYVAV